MSRGQTPRTPYYFPRMKFRAWKRSAARRYLAGGLRVREHWKLLAEDECVLMPSREWRCARTDPAHLATAEHRRRAEQAPAFAALIAYVLASPQVGTLPAWATTPATGAGPSDADTEEAGREEAPGQVRG
ncbi:hypothetical protein SAMN05421776_105348 [Nocardia farcinica]|uniref:Uncharacterized protein n=1 Tax=Nocardia farcinica TaxID=37329 RepID=A0A0H5NCW3_NOCFR|nr:hypothetical protein [Nocardia farcinica]AXK88863.1 hypothetical protein DXT66_27425 [Nocardia farcinica]PFX04009.1 hypothetical protein CJ469_01883 [Nocardia farcinica]PFX10167.1 hypothetical protein CJ468_01014 [Nocardia farcinica]CRY73680.1 Uncharacterised protein [Nocardia farcinica]SIT24809.1 hypothetical protein SAMN05421776_105348 [Nocardia farcinica]